MYFPPFPFVVPSAAQQSRIEAAAQGILDEREAIGDTLAAMYDPLTMPPRGCAGNTKRSTRRSTGFTDCLDRPRPTG